MSELIINGKDALIEFGVRMGDNFLDAIFAPVPIKVFIENKSRLENGKQVVHNEPRVDERDVTLTFNLEGSTSEDYLQKYKRFKEELLKGLVTIEVPVLAETYHLTYQRSTTFAMNLERTFSRISVKFNESNPANRN